MPISEQFSQFSQFSQQVNKGLAPRFGSCVTFVSYTAARSLVTGFYEMPVTRLRSNATGVAQLCARYVNTVTEVNFHVHSGTTERKTKAPDRVSPAFP